MSSQAEENVWGKWGEADERGALNYVTPEVVQRAAGLVRKGEVYSLGIPWRDAPAQEMRGKPVHLMRVDGGDYAAGARRPGGTQVSDDFVFLNTHQVTHVDSLSHIWFDDKLYNGFSTNTVRSAGARYCGIDKMQYLVTRGILLDFARLKEVDLLPPGYVISPEDIEACAAKQGVKVETGDAVLIRTGWAKLLRTDPVRYLANPAGIGVAAGIWLRRKEICAVAADNFSMEADPEGVGGDYLPAHKELIRQGGVYIVEMLDLEEMARDMVYESLFVIAPLGIPGGSGSPVNPLAIA